jgi:CheY-like chemotaxis protein
MAREPLRSAGYEVVAANNGENGLLAVTEHQPDCIVLDLLMPVMDGPEFLRQLRASGAEVPVIVVSADIQESSRALVEDLGISGFLNKPVKSKELLACLETIWASQMEASK